MIERARTTAALVAVALAGALGAPAWAAEASGTGSWHDDAPGRHHSLSAGDLPAPFATHSATNGPTEIAPPRGALPAAPPGFVVSRYADGLEAPRAMVVAPNGDVFVAETAAGQIRVVRGRPGQAKAESTGIFATDLDEPFGMAFYPPGPYPAWLYVANTNSVVRFPYKNGALRAGGQPQTIVAELVPATGGHSTRDLRFTADGTRMLVSVGSGSNVAESMPTLSDAQRRQWASTHALGAAWGPEDGRADVLSFTPGGEQRTQVATGLRNCVGLALQPGSGDLWCAVNERDGLGDNLVPDYVTHVRPGAWYGWPWTYLGDHVDPRPAPRPDLAGKATVPDVFIQPHSAPLGITFYNPPAAVAAAFPTRYDGDAFVTLHGSWNRATRTGYKVVRVPMKNGVAQGGYDDFLTGFVASDTSVWGRPVGVTVAADGALLVSEDANGTIYRVAPAADHAAR